MDFDFSREQYMFQDATRGLLAEHYTLDQVRAALETGGVDESLWERLAESGAFSMLVPEAFGGMGSSFVDIALVIEEYGRALVPPPVGETIAGTDVLVRFGTQEQKEQLLPQIAEGRLKIVPAVTESEAGFDPEDIMLTAHASGNSWRVSGRKVLVPQADAADLILVALRFGKDGSLGLAAIERDRDGVSLREHTTLDPAARYYEMSFDQVVLVRDDIVGGVPLPDAVARLFDASGVIAAAMMAGIAAKALDGAVAYAMQREQFGKPIGSFQAIKHRCADMAVAIEAGRSAAYYAAWALAEESPDRATAVSMAKSACGDASRFACNEGIQIHGGVGFTWELGLHFYLRRAKILEYSYGDAAFHRERVLTATLAELGIGGA